MFTLSVHAIQKAQDLGVMPLELVMVCEENQPCPNRLYPRQVRYVGKTFYTGIMVCVNVDSETGKIITVFLDQVLTPLRRDQIEAGVQIKRNR